MFRENSITTVSDDYRELDALELDGISGGVRAVFKCGADAWVISATSNSYTVEHAHNYPVD
jgi:hypothetical protein